MQVSLLVLLAGAFQGGRGVRVVKRQNSSAEPAQTCHNFCGFGFTQCGTNQPCLDDVCANGFRGFDCSACLACQVGTTPPPCEDRVACLEAYLRFGRSEACGEEWRNCQDCDICQPGWCGDEIQEDCGDYYEQYGKVLTCERAACSLCPICGDQWCPDDVEQVCIARYEEIGRHYTCQSHSDCATCGVCAEGYCPAAVETRCNDLFAIVPDRACSSSYKECLECPVCEPPNCQHPCLTPGADPEIYCEQEECSGCPYCGVECKPDDDADCVKCKNHVGWYGKTVACGQDYCDGCCACA